MSRTASIDPRDVVASFDSASVLHAATVAALARRDFPNLGRPAVYGRAVRAASTLPWPVLRRIYARIGGAEGIDPARLADVDMQAVAASFADAYEERQYPAILIGSSNGALTQLAAAAQVPWLPGTVLVPVHRVGDPARTDLALEFGRRVAPALLRRNPDIVIHQMHDAVQDELMVARMSYFRAKWSALPRAYERLLATRLAPGAPVIVIDDGSEWPVTRVSERHVFQVGGRGGLGADEYLARRYSPAADDTAPEAEWGSSPDFTRAVEDWARANGHPIVRVRVDGPQEAAHPVAVLLRRWVVARGGEGDHLIVPSFVLGDPWRTIELARVPFWTFFPVQSALDSLRHHLAHSDPYARADILVFQHGVDSPGIAAPSDFAVLARDFGAEPRLLALRPGKSPHDLGTLGRYGDALGREPDAAIPYSPLPIDEAVSALRSVEGERGRPIATPDEPEAQEHTNPLVRATDWLNETLGPILGPPTIGPDTPGDPTPIAQRPCPVCGNPMGDHEVELVDGHTFYHHPGNNPPDLMEGN